MTVEERFERLERATAGLVEERRKDREEYRQLWRQSQQRMDELTAKIAATNDAITRLTEEVRAEAVKTEERFRQTDERIDKLISAIGEITRRDQPRQ